MTRPGIEPATSRSQSGRSTTEPLAQTVIKVKCVYHMRLWWPPWMLTSNDFLELENFVPRVICMWLEINQPSSVKMNLQKKKKLSHVWSRQLPSWKLFPQHFNRSVGLKVLGKTICGLIGHLWHWLPIILINLIALLIRILHMKFCYNRSYESA